MRKTWVTELIAASVVHILGLNLSDLMDINLGRDNDGSLG